MTNPTTLEYQQAMQEMIVNAPAEKITKDGKQGNYSIREILELFKIDETTIKGNVTRLNRATRHEIVTTATFLDIKQAGRKLDITNNLKKEEIIEYIINKIQSHLPETCGVCKAVYKVGLREERTRNCHYCGQGSHDCEDADHRDRSQRIFNSEIGNGAIWLCPEHTSSLAWLKKQHSRNTEAVTEAETDVDVEEERKIETNTENDEEIVQEINVNQNGNNQENKTNNDTAKIPIKNEKKVIPKPKPIPKPNQDKRVCNYFRKGMCIYGTRGKNHEGTCPYTHPQRCLKYMNYGEDKGGCTKGINCTRLHPTPCIKSIRKGKCLNYKCTFSHPVWCIREEEAENYMAYPSNRKHHSSPSFWPRTKETRRTRQPTHTWEYDTNVPQVEKKQGNAQENQKIMQNCVLQMTQAQHRIINMLETNNQILMGQSVPTTRQGHPQMGYNNNRFPNAGQAQQSQYEQGLMLAPPRYVPVQDRTLY